MNQHVFDSLIKLIEKGTLHWADSRASLEITLTSDILGEIRSLHVEGLIQSTIKPTNVSKKKSSIDINADEKKFNFTTSYLVQINSTQYTKLYNSFNSLIELHPTTPPKSFIIFDSKNDIESYFHESTQEYKGNIKHYLEICEIWKLLKLCAEDNDANSLLFLYRNKLRIKNRYDVSLLGCEFDGFDKFKTLMNKKDVHDDEKSKILQNVLCAFLLDIPLEQRFSHLLKNFTQYESRFDDAYQAFVVGFSFDELRSEYEEKYRDYIVKINDTISSAVTKSLVLPISIFLTTTRVQSIQTAKPERVNEIFAANMGVGIVSALVSLIMILIIINETSSLHALKVEYISLMGRLEEKSKAASSKINDLSNQLDARLNNSIYILYFIGVITIIQALASSYWIYTRSTIDSFLTPGSTLVCFFKGMIKVVQFIAEFFKFYT